MLFSEMDLGEKIQQAIARIGYTEATPIQEQTITAFLTGKHIVGQSQTGTGKTAAFCLPILNAVDPTSRKVQALILCPTRELATQTQEEVYKLSFGLIGMKSVCVYGGSNVWRQKERIDAGAQIVVGTPGRVIDMIERRMLDVSALNYLVLDEADRMLDMGFVDDVEWIWKQAHAIKQVMSFSATVTNELRDLLHEHIGTDYASIKIQQEIIVDKIDHSFIMVDHGSKEEMLDKYLKDHTDQKVVIFTQMKMHTMQLADALKALGHDVFELHGDMRQYDRNRTIKAFKEGQAKILIATDVASRGLNLNDIMLVINYDVPQDPESYIHRIGRTGRAGKEGRAITMVDTREMRLLEAIEKRNKIRIKQIDEHGNEVIRPVGRDTRSGGRFGGGSSRGGFGGNRGGGRFGGGSRDGGSRFGGGSRDGGSRFGGGSRDGAPSRFGSRDGAATPSRDGGSRFGTERGPRPEGGDRVGNFPARTPHRDGGSRFGGGDRGGDRGGSRFGGGSRDGGSRFSGGSRDGGSRFGGGSRDGGERKARGYQD